MTMQITEMMVDRIKEAIPFISREQLAVEIPEMGGYFVTLIDAPIPETAKRIVEIGIDGGKYLVYNTLEEDSV